MMFPPGSAVFTYLRILPADQPPGTFYPLTTKDGHSVNSWMASSWGIVLATGLGGVCLSPVSEVKSRMFMWPSLMSSAFSDQMSEVV